MLEQLVNHESLTSFKGTCVSADPWATGIVLGIGINLTRPGCGISRCVTETPTGARSRPGSYCTCTSPRSCRHRRTGTKPPDSGSRTCIRNRCTPHTHKRSPEWT